MNTMTNELAMSRDTGVLGPALLIGSESGDAYDELLARIRAGVAPAGVLEAVWGRDVADLAWEVARLRRIKASLMRARAHEGLATALRAMDVRNYFSIASRWFAGDAVAAQTVSAALAPAGLTIDSVTALTVSERIDEIERIEKMTNAAEERRDGMLRELEMRRAKLAAKVKPGLHGAETFAAAPPAAA